MPNFLGWCDACLDFYPISREEWEKQLVEFAQMAISSEPGTTAPCLQLCPECKRSKSQSKQKGRCRRTAAKSQKGRIK